MKSIKFASLVAAVALCCMAPASAQMVTDGLVGYYSADTLTGSTASTWANSATGPGAWSAATYSGTNGTYTGVLTGQTPIAGKSAVDLTAGAGGFRVVLGAYNKHDLFDTYSGMTYLVVLKVTATKWIGGIAGPWENNAIMMNGNADSVKAYATSPTNVTLATAGPSSPVVGNWTILASDMANNTTGSDTVAHLYQTNYTAGTPTTSSWSTAAAPTAGAFKIYGQSNYDQFGFGGGLYTYGGWNCKSRSEIAAVVVYNRVLSAEERAQTTNALYTSYFTAASETPEPGSLLALGSGLVGLVGFVIRKRK